MNPVVVRKVKIGEGIPKICVSIAETTEENILTVAKQLKEQPADIIEWRVDWYENVFLFAEVERVLEQLRNIFEEVPLLFTFRTLQEGGEKSIEADKYFQLNEVAINSGYVDLLDVEMFIGDKIVSELVRQAHDENVKIIMSNHDFRNTPNEKEIVSRLCKMQELGADILKIAVMPCCKKDVLTLLTATEEVSTRYTNRPIVTMSMSDLGTISRVCGECFGSAITFGSFQKASAPGQIEIRDLKKVLQILHNTCE